MSHQQRIGMWIAVGACIGMAVSAAAFPRSSETTQKSCATCHTGPAGGAALTDAGKAYQADAAKVPAANVEGAAYVGAAKCRMCHAAEHKSWQATAHARAVETLRGAPAERVAEIAAKLGAKLAGPAGQAKECLSCHVTGQGQPGGYPGADSTKTAALAGVTCENCHGPGGKHVAAAKEAKQAAINGHPGEKLCRSCHTPEMSPKFDFAAYQAKGVHAKKTAP